jgi:hypothetical protein
MLAGIARDFKEKFTLSRPEPPAFTLARYGVNAALSEKRASV